MTPAEVDGTYAARAKALGALIEAVGVYQAYLTLKRVGFLQSDTAPDAAVCTAAAEFTAADRAYAKALEAPPLPKPAPIEYKPVSLERVRNAIIAAQKRVRVGLVQQVVMDHGGRASDGKPSLTALPREHYAACVAALESLPSG